MWLDASLVEEPSRSNSLKSIIAPHAGYSYSGSTAAYAYKHIERTSVKVIIILGPSHHVYFTKPQISSVNVLETPLGNLTVNNLIRDELLSTGLFDSCPLDVDEAEHSIEMHLPYIAKVAATSTTSTGEPIITVLPILVGNLSESVATRCGEVMARYFDDPDILFIISSDFCHWGRRFQYQPFEAWRSGCQQIHQYISWLDHQGMSLIEAKDRAGFTAYLEETNNTICGRYPIILLLATIEKSSLNVNIKFVRYAQSSAVTAKNDSSVSYASAIVECVT